MKTRGRFFAALLLSTAVMSASTHANDTTREDRILAAANEAVKNLPLFRLSVSLSVEEDEPAFKWSDADLCKLLHSSIVNQSRVFSRLRYKVDPRESGPDYPDGVEPYVKAKLEARLATVLARFGHDPRKSGHLALDYFKLSVPPSTTAGWTPIEFECEVRYQFSDPKTISYKTPNGQALFRPILEWSAMGRDLLTQRSGISLTAETAPAELVEAIRTGLDGIEMLPKHKRILQGFRAAAERMSIAFTEQEAKRSRGERYQLPTHRSFSAMASLLLSYARALQEPLDDLARFSSSERGASAVNSEMVELIRKATGYLEQAYGLETELQSNLLADSARVMADLISSQVKPIATPAEIENVVKPLLADLSRLIATSETQGDVAAMGDLERLLKSWSAPEVQRFVNDRLSAADATYTSMATQLMMLVERMRKHAGVR